MISALISGPVKQLLTDFPGLVGLSDLLNKTGSELTSDDIQRVAAAFGLQGRLTPGLEAAFRGLLAGHNINRICDCIQDPESLMRLGRAARVLFSPTRQDENWLVPGLKTIS